MVLVIQICDIHDMGHIKTSELQIPAEQIRQKSPAFADVHSGMAVGAGYMETLPGTRD